MWEPEPPASSAPRSLSRPTRPARPDCGIGGVTSPVTLQLVAFRSPRAPRPGRLWQLEWGAVARLEERTPANGERDWLAHHGRPGPPSGIVESGRASSVRSNQRQSGRTATGQLPHNLPAHPPHPHHIRSPLQGIPRSSSLAHAEGPRRLRERADPCRSKPLDPPVAGTTSPEVHHFSQSFSTEVTKLV